MADRNRAEDILLRQLVEKKLKKFQDEANKHKNLYRALWLTATGMSLAIAMLTNFDFAIYGAIQTGTLASILGITLPAITAYVVLRSPEELWIYEIRTRNRLFNLKERIDLEFGSTGSLDEQRFRDEYFDIMRDADAQWAAIKGGKQVS
ncbi:MAG: hypothetical protein JJT88_00485 [Gammaproteobacteria bacterium]|nr:hypothetical protein [Gammaproteobacteria bacterium]